MAKGVVMCPIVNTSIQMNASNIITYGTPTTVSGSYCVGYQGQNSIDIPVLYAGKVADAGGHIAYGANYNNVSIYQVTSSGSTSHKGLTSTGFVTGLNYSYAIGGLTNYFPAAVMDYDAFDNISEMALFISNMVNVRISYIAGAIMASGPKLVSEGSEVKAYLSIPKGVVVTDSDISITKNGVTVPFTYSNGVLTFTA